MEFENLLWEERDGLVVITVNRPKVLNALNAGTISDLDRAIQTVRERPELRAVIVTGAGDKAFVAGADIKELAEVDAVGGQALARRGQEVFRRLEMLGRPVIAAVNGFALGGGCELAMACTLRLAAAGARLGQPEVKLGLIPGYGGTQRLARLVGAAKALELILTGEPIDADEACRIGLVNRVVPGEKLMEEAEALARAMMDRGPVAVRLATDAVYRGLDMSLDDGLELESVLFGLSCATEDKGEGTRAFLEKRPARFRGN